MASPYNPFQTPVNAYGQPQQYAPQAQQSGPPDLAQLMMQMFSGGGQQFDPVDEVNAKGRNAMELMQLMRTPKQTSPWAQTMSPERQAMYGRVSQNALGTATNPFSWDRSGDVQRWAAGPTPIQNQMWLNRQAPQVQSPQMPWTDMFAGNGVIQNRVMPNMNTAQLQAANPFRQDPGWNYGTPPPLPSPWASFGVSANPRLGFSF